MKDTTMAWQRSTYCATAGCIEVARIDDTVQLRDSKNPHLPAVVFSPAEWNRFQDSVLAIGKRS
ncbi:DUF397 domain-containing protein [Actinoplanes sp. NPDC049802]|uniref:DUF397 domain-containing protein n=1 Tax=Actinoplanes sp. NPDC049802 TaxID=3154742 RepID=UPI0034016B8A